MCIIFFVCFSKILFSLQTRRQIVVVLHPLLNAVAHHVFMRYGSYSCETLGQSCIMSSLSVSSFLSLLRGWSCLFPTTRGGRFKGDERFFFFFLNVSSEVKYMLSALQVQNEHKLWKKNTQHSQSWKECWRQYINTYTIATTSLKKKILRGRFKIIFFKHLKYIIIQ